MVFYASFLLIRYAAWLISGRENDLFTQAQGSMVCVRAKFLPPPGPTRGSDTNIQTKITFDMFHIFCLRGFKPHRRHCVVVLEQDTFILAKYWFNPGRLVPV